LIAGKWRGRRLLVLEREGLRPTKDAIRETLFNWLMPYLHGAHCLDLYAGSGALGFEAASRGAASVTLVEKDRGASQVLSKNASALEAENITVLNTTAEQQVCSGLKRAVDIVFFDPPFDLGQTAIGVLADLLSSSMMSDDAVIYIEQDRKNGLPILPEGWEYHRKKTMGQVAYGLVVRTGFV